MKTQLKKIICCILCFATFFSLSTVYAEKNIQLIEQGKEYEVYAKEMQQYISKKPDGTLVLDAPHNSINKKYHSIVLNSMKTTNIMIKTGYLKANEKCNIIVTEKYVDYVKNEYARQNKENSISQERSSIGVSVVGTGNTITITETISNEYSLRAGGNVTNIVWTAAGFKLYLSSEHTILAANGQLGSAGILAIWFPEPLVSKCIATALVASGTLLHNANAAGRGVIVSFAVLSYIPPKIVPYWISSQ